MKTFIILLLVEPSSIIQLYLKNFELNKFSNILSPISMYFATRMKEIWFFSLVSLVDTYFSLTAKIQSIRRDIY